MDENPSAQCSAWPLSHLHASSGGSDTVNPSLDVAGPWVYEAWAAWRSTPQHLEPHNIARLPSQSIVGSVDVRVNCSRALNIQKILWNATVAGPTQPACPVCMMHYSNLPCSTNKYKLLLLPSDLSDHGLDHHFVTHLMSVPPFGCFFVGASYPIYENNFTRVDATHWVRCSGALHILCAMAVTKHQPRAAWHLCCNTLFSALL
jgi:hypothetical protein